MDAMNNKSSNRRVQVRWLYFNYGTFITITSLAKKWYHTSNVGIKSLSLIIVLFTVYRNDQSLIWNTLMNMVFKLVKDVHWEGKILNGFLLILLHGNIWCIWHSRTIIIFFHLSFIDIRVFSVWFFFYSLVPRKIVIIIIIIEE